MLFLPLRPAALLVSALTVMTAAAQRAGRDMVMIPMQVTKVSVGSPGKDSVPVNIEVQSSSSRAITAYAVEVILKYGTLTLRKLVSQELVQATLAPAPDAPRKMLNGAIGYVESKAALEYEGQGLASGNAVIAAVVLEDGTAMGSPSVITSLMNGRRALARECGSILKEIQAAQAEPQVVAAFAGKDPNATAALKKALLRRLTGNPQSRHDRELNHFANSLQAGITYFQAEVSQYKELQQALQQQSIVKPAE
jgi:hypothetical protein